MAGSDHAALRRVFISYRRDDTAVQAGWLYDQLAEHFGVLQVFKDVETIQPGDDFVEAINAELRSCGALLVLIGDKWLTPRLRDRHDFVRLELEAAFAARVRVIPILVGGAKMPSAGDLPRSIAGLARTQALELTGEDRWGQLSELLTVLINTLTPTEPPPTAPRLVRTVVCPTSGGASHVAFSHDGRMLACAGGAGTIGMIRLDGPSPPQVSDDLGFNTGGVLSAAFSPRKWLLACGYQDGAVRLWNLHSRAELRPLTGHHKAVLGLAFSPDGRLLASGGLDDTVTLWEPEASVRRQRRTVQAEDSVWAVSFSPDGRMLATAGGRDLKVRLWNPANGKLVRTLIGHDERVTALTFSPDGQLLASGGGQNDETVRLWNPVSGALLRTLTTGHRGDTNSVAFSPDGRLLATSGAWDGTVRLWDPATGAQLRTLTGNGHAGKTVFSPTGWRAGGPTGWLLASASGDVTQLWYLAPPNGSLPVAQGDLIRVRDVIGLDGPQSHAQVLARLPQQFERVGGRAERGAALRIGAVFLDEMGLQGGRDFVGRFQRVIDGPVPCSVVNHGASMARASGQRL
jgi:WD40 repeat protein